MSKVRIPKSSFQNRGWRYGANQRSNFKIKFHESHFAFEAPIILFHWIKSKALEIRVLEFDIDSWYLEYRYWRQIGLWVTFIVARCLSFFLWDPNRETYLWDSTFYSWSIEAQLIQSDLGLSMFEVQSSNIEWLHLRFELCLKVDLWKLLSHLYWTIWHLRLNIWTCLVTSDSSCWILNSRFELFSFNLFFQMRLLSPVLHIWCLSLGSWNSIAKLELWCSTLEACSTCILRFQSISNLFGNWMSEIQHRKLNCLISDIDCFIDFGKTFDLGELMFEIQCLINVLFSNSMFELRISRFTFSSAIMRIWVLKGPSWYETFIVRF